MSLTFRFWRPLLPPVVALGLIAGAASAQSSDDTSVRPPTGRAFPSTIVDLPGTLPQPEPLQVPRVAPLPESEWSDEQRELYAELMGPGVSDNALRTILRMVERPPTKP